MTRTLRRAGLAAVLLALVTACAAPPVPGPVGRAATSAATSATPAAPVASVPPPAPDAALAPSAPVGIAVPAIGVRVESLLALGIAGDGELEVPPDAASAGWFTLGPTPGARGPAVIAGHVDYAGVPGVFHRLAELAPGDEVSVPRADGSRAVFGTYRVDRYAKSEFPTERVYGDTGGPELRLITCGGAFDTRSGHYSDNVVAYARLVGVVRERG
ncbi:class F sortase [Pseudonocardia kunmingensis]|uniref:Sortase family protein n=1 Tax=Pseudonocardia kunmingensis TaxID=630975 RepID=A0A543DAE2_9PSEU|nr:class F sortase [Pseudonocardia kunmingensis]TQM06255.1 sortase family protein [Pseudonocardia kunmingensis]